MKLSEVMSQLEKLGNEQQRKTYRRHGANGNMFGVKIGDLKVVAKKIKGDQALALDLYKTGNLDAMYLAGLIADDARMTRKDLQRWVEQAFWHMISDYTVPWVAAGSPHGHDLALEWIDSKKESIASAGWATLGGLVATQEDDDLDMAELKKLLQRVQKTIHGAPNPVRYAMNGFVIAVGCYVRDLTEAALQTAAKVGPVTVDMGNTACKVPSAAEYIRKVQDRGTIGKKRKTAKC